MGALKVSRTRCLLLLTQTSLPFEHLTNLLTNWISFRLVLGFPNKIEFLGLNKKEPIDNIWLWLCRQFYADVMKWGVSVTDILQVTVKLDQENCVSGTPHKVDKSIRDKVSPVNDTKLKAHAGSKARQEPSCWSPQRALSDLHMLPLRLPLS